jgi:hypothetical protein
MRSNAAPRGIQALSLCAILGLTISLGAVGAATGSAGDVTAVASKKKKCKKSLRKCAPKRYHLSASGTFTGGRGSQVWSAEIDLGKRRASAAFFPYAQDGGTVTVSEIGTTFDSHCTSPDEATYTVQQTLNVPSGGRDFRLTFGLSGSNKNTYALAVGAPEPETSTIKGTATITCPEGTSHTHEYAYSNLLADVIARGKVGGSPLTGSAQGRGESVTWKLTAKK